MKIENIKKAYELAKEMYAAIGVDTDAALKAMEQVNISLHCWQADDVVGFESSQQARSGGIQATGNYPGKATTFAELRRDIDEGFRLLPGTQRLQLHAISRDFQRVTVDQVSTETHHLQGRYNGA